MSITAKDVAAVRKVLSGKMPPHVMAQTYPPQTLLLVAVAILAGADKTIFSHGEYGSLLTELVVIDAVPAEGWPMGEDGPVLPDWYDKKRYFQYIPASRRRGLHSSLDRGGNVIILQVPPELQALLDENPQYARKAERLFIKAEGEVAKAAEEKRRQAIHRSNLRFRGDY